MAWRDYKIRTKLTIGFGSLIALIIVITIIGYTGIQTVGDSLFRVGEEEAPVVDMAMGMIISMNEAQIALLEYVDTTLIASEGVEGALEHHKSAYEGAVKDFDTFADAILLGGTVGDKLVLKTDNREIVDLVKESDNIHNTRFQTSAASIIQASDEMILDKKLSDEAMEGMETVYDEVFADTVIIEELVSGELQRKTSSANANLRLIIRQEVILADMVNELKTSLAQTRIKIEEFVRMSTTEDMDAIESEYNEFINQFDFLITTILEGGVVDGIRYPGTDSAELANRIREIDQNHTDFQISADFLFTYHRKEMNSIKQLEEEITNLQNDVVATEDVLSSVEGLISGEMNEAKIEGAAATTSSIMFMIITGAVSILVGFFLGVIITKGLSGPLKKASSIANDISEGNFDVDVSQKKASKDEIGMLNKSFQNMVGSLQYKGKMVEEVAKGNLTIDVKLASDKDVLGGSLVEMTDSLNKLLGNVNMSVNQVNIGADQVSQASQSLSQGATEQASSLEEISASITQINSQSRQNAENATEANGLAKQATIDAEKGNKEMESLSLAMEKINTSSDQIKKIVKVIDDIAFQTNLLALNANVEAARAGKYGKGFAVVADEVRNLAVRSAEAVKETTEMVDDSIKNIESGNKAVEATATQLESIMVGSSKVATFLEEIATASKEQAGAIDQITQGLEQIDQVTQSNTASAEESAAAAEELASQSVQLKNMIATFKLKDIQEAPAAQTRQLEYQAPRASAPIAHTVPQHTETGIKPVDPTAVISLDDEDFDRF